MQSLGDAFARNDHSMLSAGGSQLSKSIIKLLMQKTPHAAQYASDLLEALDGGSAAAAAPPPSVSGAAAAARPAPAPPSSVKRTPRRCPSCLPFDHEDGVVNPPPQMGGHKCYTECARLGMKDGKDGFLSDGDVELAKKRLSLISVYIKHLKDNASTHDEGTFAVRNCTGRQKRLVAYYKIYRHIFSKGVHGVRRTLPACACILVRQWFPDDADDRKYQQQIEDGEVEYNLDDLLEEN